ncbi:unnamed protein product [Chrysoparadoxa australica]
MPQQPQQTVHRHEHKSQPAPAVPAAPVVPAITPAPSPALMASAAALQAVMQPHGMSPGFVTSTSTSTAAAAVPVPVAVTVTANPSCVPMLQSTALTMATPVAISAVSSLSQSPPTLVATLTSPEPALVPAALPAMSNAATTASQAQQFIQQQQPPQQPCPGLGHGPGPDPALGHVAVAVGAAKLDKSLAPPSSQPLAQGASMMSHAGASPPALFVQAVADNEYIKAEDEAGPPSRKKAKLEKKGEEVNRMVSELVEESREAAQGTMLPGTVVQQQKGGGA